MKKFRIYGEVVASERDLPALLGCEANADDIADYVVAWGTGAADQPRAWLWERRIAERTTLAAGRVAGGLMLHVPGLADFVVCGRTISVHPATNDDRSVEQVLLDQALPRTLQANGRLCLHGSSVIVGQRAHVFLGQSGEGKSTLAAFLVSRGIASFLSDDVAALQLDCVAPGYPSVRLHPTTVTALFGENVYPQVSLRQPNKQRVPMPPAPVPIPLGAVHVLARTERRESTRLLGQLAFMALATHTRRLDTESASAGAAEIEQLVALAKKVSVRQLSVGELFTASADEIRRLLEGE